ncbi:hypothetical protein WN943_011456 [Citrus x changshan-huyou]
MVLVVLPFNLSTVFAMKWSSRLVLHIAQNIHYQLIILLVTDILKDTRTTILCFYYQLQFKFKYLIYFL